MTHLCRLFAGLTFLLVTLATNQNARAQGARGLPDPIPSAGLERFLEGVGAKDPPAASIDGPMSGYLVAIDALVQTAMASPGVEIDMSMFAKASADRAQIRFARTELDERAVRSLLAILTPGQAGKVEKARRSAPRIEGIRGLEGLDGLQDLEGLDAIGGGGIFIGG